MKAVLEFDLPEDQDALRAAIDGIDHIVSIRGFYERLRSLDKHGHKFNSIEETISCLYDDYHNMMQPYL